MSKILVGNSPYRTMFRQERINQSQSKVKEAVMTREIVKIEINSFTIMIILFILVFVLGGIYLMNFNDNETKGYILKRLELSQQELIDQNNLKNIALADAKAMNQMIESGSLDRMRKPGEVEYIFGDSILAKAN